MKKFVCINCGALSSEKQEECAVCFSNSVIDLNKNITDEADNSSGTPPDMSCNSCGMIAKEWQFEKYMQTVAQKKNSPKLYRNKQYACFRCGKSGAQNFKQLKH